MTKPVSESASTRRDFLKTAAAGTVAATMGGISAVHAAGSDAIKVGVIGCGGRGRGAATDVLQAAPGVTIVAVGDYFKDRASDCRQRLLTLGKDEETKKIFEKMQELGNKVDLPEERCFFGLDAYQKVINAGVDYVILATPPGFRPIHLKTAIDAGKHVFTEKPVAVDGPGIRTCFKVHEDALAKKLGIGAGTQRRHQLGYLQTIQQIQDGAIGEIVGARCYWNQGHIWFRQRKEGMTDLDYQIHNWYHFVWLCGDHHVEQHVHNLDVVNWATQQHPLRAVGMGGRVMPCSDPNKDGHIFNFFAIDYEYKNGLHVLSMSRQINGCEGNVSEALAGSKGFCQVDRQIIRDLKGATVWQSRDRGTNPYVQEHTDLIASIRAGKPINELKSVAESTLTAIMGRMSAYTGKAVSWEEALNSKESLMPSRLEASSTLPVPPVAVPGQTRLI